MSESCNQIPGSFRPLIDRNRCEGKADCVVICPYEVFDLQIVPPADRTNLGIGSKIKGLLHGWRQAYAVNAEACRACGLCVSACPEKAIKLARATPAGT